MYVLVNTVASDVSRGFACQDLHPLRSPPPLRIHTSGYIFLSAERPEMTFPKSVICRSARTYSRRPFSFLTTRFFRPTSTPTAGAPSMSAIAVLYEKKTKPIRTFVDRLTRITACTEELYFHRVETIPLYRNILFTL